MKVGQRLRAERERAGLSRPQLAKETGVSERSIQDLENLVYRKATSEVLKTVEAYFRIDPGSYGESMPQQWVDEALSRATDSQILAEMHARFPEWVANAVRQAEYPVLLADLDRRLAESTAATDSNNVLHMELEYVEINEDTEGAHDGGPGA